jgi:uncharacterized membrane protein YvbJ
MTSFVFCRGCAQQIHETATTCPTCGAPQVTLAKPIAATATSPTVKPEIHNYADVPWFRKRWFAIVCILLFMPAFLVIAFTGDVYFEKNGELKTLPKRSRYIVLGIFLLMVFIQIASK